MEYYIPWTLNCCSWWFSRPTNRFLYCMWVDSCCNRIGCHKLEVFITTLRNILLSVGLISRASMVDHTVEFIELWWISYSNCSMIKSGIFIEILALYNYHIPRPPKNLAAEISLLTHPFLWRSPESYVERTHLSLASYFLNYLLLADWRSGCDAIQNLLKLSEVDNEPHACTWHMLSERYTSVHSCAYKMSKKDLPHLWMLFPSYRMNTKLFIHFNLWVDVYINMYAYIHTHTCTWTVCTHVQRMYIHMHSVYTYAHTLVLYVHMYAHTLVLYVHVYNVRICTYMFTVCTHKSYTSAHWCAHEIVSIINSKQG